GRRGRRVKHKAGIEPALATCGPAPRTGPGGPLVEVGQFHGKQDRQDPHGRAQIAPATGQQVDAGPGDEAEGDAVGDREGQRHGQGGDGHRRGHGQDFPVDAGQAGQHQHGHEHQRRRSGIGGDGAGQRREEQAEQEQDGHHAGGQAGAATGADTGGGFHVAGGGGGTQGGTGHGGGAVGQQGTAQARHVAILVHQAGTLGHADQGAGGVEQVDEQEGEHHADQTDVQGTPDVQFQQGRHDRRRHGDDAVQRGQAQRDGDGGDGQDADHHGAGDLAGGQGADDEEAQGGQDRTGSGDFAQGDQGGRMINHDAGVLQGDDGQEQADTGADAGTQRQRHAVDDPLADLEGRQQEEKHAGQEHGTQAHLPAVAHGQHHGVGEEGVQAHARSQGDRVVGQQTHQGRADGGGQAGGNEHGALVHAGFRQHGGVDEQDVGHGQEGGETGQDLGAHVGVVRTQLEQLFQHDGFPEAVIRRLVTGWQS